MSYSTTPELLSAFHNRALFSPQNRPPHPSSTCHYLAMKESACPEMCLLKHVPLLKLNDLELMDLSKTGLEYQNTAVISTRSVLRKSPDTFRKFIRAYSSALAVFHTQRETTLKVMAKFLKGIDPVVLEKSYDAYREWVPEIPYINHAGMETVIAMTPGADRGRGVKAADIVDETFVKELDQQGFYRALYKR